MAARGRPAFAPNDKQRGQVEAMHVCGCPEKDIAVALNISEPLLRKHFRAELDVSLTKLKVEISNWLVNSILGKTGNGILTDERARATLGIFWLKTRAGWKETTVLEHRDIANEDDALKNVDRRVARIAAAKQANSVPQEPQ